MKHARKKPTDSSTSASNTPQKSNTPRTGASRMTEADFRKKYLYDDPYADFSRKLSSQGRYQTRSLDNYIPSDRLESKVKRRPVSDDTQRINTRDVNRAGASGKNSTSSGTKSKTTKTSKKQHFSTSLFAI